MTSSMLPDLIKESFENARDHGFHEAISGEFQIPLRLVLIHEEVSEALKEFRITPQGQNEMPDSFVEELADVMIRLCDLIGFPEIGTDRFINILLEKMKKNRARPQMHGGRRM